MPVFYYIGGVALALFAGLRKDVGTDYQSYATTFNDIKVGANLTDFEPLNMLLVDLVHSVGGGNGLIFLCYSIVTLSGVVYFSKRMSSSKELSVFVFMTVSIFYFSTFNLVRQWAAISMMLFAIPCLVDRKYLRMTALIVAACLFHLSALVLVVMPLLTVRFSKWWVGIAALLSGALAELLLAIIQRLPFVHYLNDVFHSDKVGSLPLFAAYVAFLVFSVVALGYFDTNRQMTRSQVAVLNMCLLSIVVLIMGFLLGLDFQATMRANVYFSVQLIVVVPWLLSTLARSTRIVAYAMVLMTLPCIYWGTLYFKGTDYILTPYQTIESLG
jgi:hypothetical protein